MKIVVTPRGFAKCGLDNVKIIEDAGFSVEYNDTGNAYTKEEFYKTYSYLRFKCIVFALTTNFYI